jgi:hypothetical protein
VNDETGERVQSRSEKFGLDSAMLAKVPFGLNWG